MEYIPCCTASAEEGGLLPASRLASKNILIEKNIKKQTVPALCVYRSKRGGAHKHSGFKQTV
jgi:hypothetical protein